VGDVTDKSVISSKHFYALSDYNDVLCSMAVRCFAIRMHLTIYFYTMSISVDNECVGKMTTELSEKS
jgi:hypothetical protein